MSFSGVLYVPAAAIGSLSASSGCGGDGPSPTVYLYVETKRIVMDKGKIANSAVRLSQVSTANPESYITRNAPPYFIQTSHVAV
jgi:hypothetical protein